MNISQEERDAMRRAQVLIDSRKWRDAYHAVDQLLFVREKAANGLHAIYCTTPTSVTSLCAHQLKLSIRLGLKGCYNWRGERLRVSQ